MVWEGRALGSLTEGDIDALIEGAVPESRSVDYKAALPGTSDAEKKEFLADVSSLANAEGGHLIFGIEEEAGVAVRKPGLAVADTDAEQLRLDSIVRSGLAPRLPALGIHAIPLAEGRFVFVVRVPGSYQSPHMVTFQNWSRFFARTSAGKYQLDVGELRTAFTLSDRVAERVRAFRADRLAQIAGGLTPVSLLGHAKTVLHLVPLAGPAGGSVDLSTVAMGGRLNPPYTTASDSRYNLDGYLAMAERADGESSGYAQLYRNGTIEGVDAWVLRLEENGHRYIPSKAFDQLVVDAIGQYASLQRELGVEPPVIVMLSLLGVRGMSLAYKARLDPEATLIDRNSLIIPDVLIESFDDSPATVVRPLLDAVWNAAGLPRCLHYDEQGDFNVERQV